MCIRDRRCNARTVAFHHLAAEGIRPAKDRARFDAVAVIFTCLLYTSDAADDLLCVDLGGRRITKKKKITRPTLLPSQLQLLVYF